MRFSANKGIRIPLLFFLGIGIPCLLLGYLAFRGIQNDQALLEKERLNEHLKMLEQITGSVKENTGKAEQAFSNLSINHQETDQSLLIQAVDSLKKQYPLVEEFFILRNSGEINLPASELLYLPDTSTQLSSVSPHSSSSAIKVRTGQQFEFQQNDYPKALVSYREEFGQASDLPTKAELLSAIGRVQKKSRLFRDAKETYGLMARDYDYINTAGGVPMGLAARLEICSLSVATGDTLTALKALMDLYEDLLNRKWVLRKAQFDFFSQQIKASADLILSTASPVTSLKPYQSNYVQLQSLENNRRKITERIRWFKENAAADLKAVILLNPEELSSSDKRLTLESGAQTYLVSLPGNVKEYRSREIEIPGLLMNTEYLRDSLLAKKLQLYVSSGKTGWILKGRNDKIILKSEKLPSGPVTARTNFEGGFPPWSVELYQEEPDLFESFLFSRRGIYFIMFFLLAGILIFGLTLTVRTVAHELELSKMKSDFVSTISHEFKSPLSSIRQLSEMLQSGRVISENSRKQYYDVLVEQSERLSLLVDNILDFSRMEEGRKIFDFEMTEIGPFLKETVAIIQDRVRHNGIVIQVEIEKNLPSARIDRGAIVQAINNLTDNAIKYSGEAKNIVIRSFVEDQHLTISVKDFGIGIRKEEIDKVFERFYRGGDELTRKVKGSGLGLTLVKQIMEVHHGAVDVESEPGLGSTFSIKLPMDRV